MRSDTDGNYLGLLLNLLKPSLSVLAASHPFLFLAQDTSVVIFLILMFLHLGSALLATGRQAK